MGIEQANPFSNSTSGGYYTRDSAESSITSATSSLVSGKIFSDLDVIENKKPIMGVTVVDDYGSTQGTGSITVTDYNNIHPTGGTHSITLTSTTGYINTVIASSSTTSSEELALAEFHVATSNSTTATNIRTAINGLERYTAEIDGSDNTKINITQELGGSAGNTTITLLDPLSGGMTAVNFTGGIDPDLKLQGSHNGTDWTDITTLDSTFPGSTGVYTYYPDLSNIYVPFWRMICNSTGLSVGTSGTSKFFYLYK